MNPKIFYSLEEDFPSTFLVDFGWTFFLGGTGNGVGDGIAHFSFFLSPLREQGDGRSEKYCLHHSQIKKIKKNNYSDRYSYYNKSCKNNNKN